MLTDKKQALEHQICFRRLYLGVLLAVVDILSWVWARATEFEDLKLRALASATAFRVYYSLHIFASGSTLRPC